MEMEPSRFASYRRIVARGRHITLTNQRGFSPETAAAQVSKFTTTTVTQAKGRDFARCVASLPRATTVGLAPVDIGEGPGKPLTRA